MQWAMQSDYGKLTKTQPRKPSCCSTQQQRDKSLKRHEATNAAKEEFCLFWANGKFENRSEAARRFLRMLDREDRNPFTGRQHSTVRTLIRALRVWLREEQSTDYEGPENE